MSKQPIAGKFTQAEVKELEAEGVPKEVIAEFERTLCGDYTRQMIEGLGRDHVRRYGQRRVRVNLRTEE